MTLLSPQPTFLVELSKVLANPGNSQVARVAAGLQIKNSLTSKDPDIKAQYQQRWLAIDANARREVKNFVSIEGFLFSSFLPLILGLEGWLRNVVRGFPDRKSFRGWSWALEQHSVLGVGFFWMSFGVGFGQRSSPRVLGHFWGGI